MPDTEQEPPFEAYRGSEPFIFVSYAHKDAPSVFPELLTLRGAGYRIWFDEGIDPGNEWPEEIAKALQGASLFLVFISPAAVASRNVRNEIYHALQLEKDFLAVHLCETQMPGGLQLSISSIQAVLKYRMSPQSYWRKMQQVLPATLRDPASIPEEQRTEETDRRPVAEERRQREEAERAAAAETKRKAQLPGKVGDVWTNTLGMKFAFIPAGEFDMGSPATEAGRYDDETLHHVKITKPFVMATTTVTQAQWMAVMGVNPSYFKGDDLPVETVKWDDAVLFCEKLGINGEGKKYRLPTEAEWEYACRAGTTTPFNTGATISTDQANYDGNYTYGAGVKGVNRGKTTPVGSFPPNKWGLYDMHGNAWQWCADVYGDYPTGPVTDPTGPAQDPNASRVVRGGSWNLNPRSCRSASRGIDAPAGRDDGLGFRVVLDSP